MNTLAPQFTVPFPPHDGGILRGLIQVQKENQFMYTSFFISIL